MSTRGGKAATREEIWSAAHRLFLANGYAGTPVRDIAAEAGVDPALVIRYFGSKELLFLETMKLDVEQRAVLDGDIATLGVRFIDYTLTAQAPTRNMFLALLRASETQGVGSHLRAAHDEQFVAPLLERLQGPDAELRARLAAALVGGMLYSLWVVGDEYLLAADHHTLVQRYGALLQQLITP